MQQSNKCHAILPQDTYKQSYLNRNQSKIDDREKYTCTLSIREKG